MTRHLFQVARPASTRRNGTKTALWLVLVWSGALGVLPWALRCLDRRLGLPPLELPGRRSAGAALLVTGSAVGLAAARAMARDGEGTPVPFDAARRLVVTGPYRSVRNPMALSAVVQGTGVGLLLGSAGALLVPAVAATLWQRVLRPREEAFLAQRFGTEFAAYRTAVRCWLPGRRYRPGRA